MNTAQVSEHFGKSLVGLVLLLCTVTFLLTYPKVVSIRDEGAYVRQASLFAAGKLTLTQESTDKIVHEAIVSRYPAGTSLLMAPWIAVFGWRGAFVSAFVSLLVLVLVTAQWLKDQALSPLASLGLLLYPATVASSRLAMSDLPCTALVTLALWQFWRARNGDWKPMFISGFLGGLSILFRESQVLVLAPFLIGSVLRRDPKWHFALLGGLLGCSFRLALSWIIFGNPFFYAKPADVSMNHLATNFGFTMFCMIILLPGGLLFPIFYKGPRALELRLAVYGLLSFHCTYDSLGQASGFLKTVILGGRFFLPICPLIIIAAAEVFSRLQGQWPSRLKGGAEVLWRKLPSYGAVALIVSACFSVVGINAGMKRYSRADVEVIAAIYGNIPDGSALVTNELATDKWLNELNGNHAVTDLSGFNAGKVDTLLQHNDRFFIVLLERFDSEFWRLQNQANRAAIAAILKGSISMVVLDRTFGPDYRLWLCRVQRPEAKVSK